MKVKLLEPLAGYSDIAEYRPVVSGDCYISEVNHREVNVAGNSFASACRLVLTPLPPPEPKLVPWTLRDAINHMSCTFRNKHTQMPVLRALGGDEQTLYLASNHCISYGELLDYWEWSKDGEHWWPCGTSVTDTPSS